MGASQRAVAQRVAHSVARVPLQWVARRAEEFRAPAPVARQRLAARRRTAVLPVQLVLPVRAVPPQAVELRAGAKAGPLRAVVRRPVGVVARRQEARVVEAAQAAV